ncbi:PREDICTED: uncharacterized protein LOC106810366 [Priapulus caudatus]|uniref:Uncharacterized protein LOC106810366 n=1 Tax=Priapulus caudatus TaxID=37621 RepID=A0ABM1EAF4_PRICU|nr:PREDICTED: uncharacterized protein LOC106810366 [Priapulus caudatus]
MNRYRTTSASSQGTPPPVRANSAQPPSSQTSPRRRWSTGTPPCTPGMHRTPAAQLPTMLPPIMDSNKLPYHQVALPGSPTKPLQAAFCRGVHHVNTMPANLMDYQLSGQQQQQQQQHPGAIDPDDAGYESGPGNCKRSSSGSRLSDHLLRTAFNSANVPGQSAVTS